MTYREGTNDWNTLIACMTEDEYQLRDVELGHGAAVDIGAYAGGVAISLALDNPDARILAVEPLPANITLIDENIRQNGLEDRITLVPRAAGRPGQRKATIRWAFGDDESGRHHRYVGNSTLSHHSAVHEEAQVDCVDLAQLVKMAGGSVALLKIDCEGAEYDILASPAVKDCRDIRGEYHAGWQPLVDLLDATHHVTRLGGTDHFGEFRAVRK